MSDGQPRKLVIILGLVHHAREVARERGLTQRDAIIVSPRGNGAVLRGLSGDVEVLMHESWRLASAKLLDEVESSLAIIRATSRSPR